MYREDIENRKKRWKRRRRIERLVKILRPFMKAYSAALAFYQDHTKAVRISVAAAAGLLVVLIVSGSIISARAKDKYPDLSGEVVEITAEDGAKDGGTVSWDNCIDVDFGELSGINPEIRGWLFFEDENISYPLLYSGDNEKYLDTGYDGKPLDRGSIFIDGRNDPDMEDIHTIIYGHDMRDGQMFGKLEKYEEDPEYYKGHRYFQILLPEARYRYEIIGYEHAPADSSRYRIEFSNQAAADSFMDELDEVNKDGIRLGRGDKIVTLSTCDLDDDSGILVHAVRIDFSRSEVK